MIKTKNIFWLLNAAVFCCAANQYSEVTNIFSKFEKRVPGLRVNDIKRDTENASNWDDFGFGVNSESRCHERALLGVFIENIDLYFNPGTADNVGLCLSGIVWVFQTFCHFLWLCEGGLSSLDCVLKFVQNQAYF